ncbi:hypothetical protein Q31b_53480 [Novipirellula aureliae]|uniref:Uncharacterized protein n=1 Tax=Novipirellula aureliae TaxID=2527966 RepID=A0A5C6DEZ5_9BACT|nr:hypothetical protein [Novipirellula aureliae]TWU35252.1 hypothetical protein Q31b_53480 [Novipirellula aureliae]
MNRPSVVLVSAAEAIGSNQGIPMNFVPPPRPAPPPAPEKICGRRFVGGGLSKSFPIPAADNSDCESEPARWMQIPPSVKRPHSAYHLTPFGTGLVERRITGID